MPADVTAERTAEYAAVIARVAAWAVNQPDIRAVAVVGSWARGSPRMDSDVDLVVLTERPQRYADREDWVAAAAGAAAPIIRSQWWGDVRERRVRLASGFEVEFGFAPADWARTNPVDRGTAEVAAAGLTAVHDPDGILRDLRDAV